MGQQENAGRLGVQDGPQRHKKMPFSQILVFTATNLAQGVMLTMPFTVAVYMVRAFLGGSGDEAQIGRLTGLLAAVYSFSQFTTSYAWGIFSSRFGRKPVMVLGSGASSVTLLWFGLSGRFSTAVAARVVAGLLNGIIVAWKCSIGESCDALEQGRVLSYMSLSWGIGCILGPSIGGVASMPCSTWGKHLSGCQPGGLLQTRPYFLPCAISALVNAVALALNLFVLRETLPHLVAARQAQQADSACNTGGAHNGESSSSDSEAGQQQQESSSQQAGLQRMLGSSAVRVQASLHSAAQRLMGRPAAHYERVGSQIAPTSSSSCGAGCTGCSTCWELWRAESGTLQGGAHKEQQQQQQQGVHHLRHEDSAVMLQLAVVKAATADCPAGGVDVGRQLRPNDSVSERTLHQARLAGGKLQADSSEQQQQQHCQDFQQNQQQLQQELSNAAPSLSVQGSDAHNSGDQGCSDCTDCTIIVTSQQEQQQQHSIGLQQLDSTPAPDDQPLLHKQQQSSSSSSSRVSLPWYKQRQVVLVLLAYGTVALLFCAIDELTPIFASAPLQQGGLKLSEVQLAGPLSFSGVCLILISLFAFPAAQKAWGTLTVTRQGLVMAVVVAFAIPCTSFAAQHSNRGTADAVAADIGWMAWALLYVAMMLKSLAGCFAFTGTMIVVNTSVEDPQQLSAVNGVGQSLASLARGIGPAVGGLLWGMTVNLQGHVFGAQLLPFACVASTAVVALLIYACVKPTDGVEVSSNQHGSSCCQE